LIFANATVVFSADVEIDYTQSGGIDASYAVIKPWLAQNLPIFSRRIHALAQAMVSSVTSRRVRADLSCAWRG
jgi:hypothetical protein